MANLHAAESESDTMRPTKKLRLASESSETEIEVETTIIDSSSGDEAEITGSSFEDQASPTPPKMCA